LCDGKRQEGVGYIWKGMTLGQPRPDVDRHGVLIIEPGTLEPMERISG
jgi:hypothetical protein